VLGEEHPDTLISISNMGRLLQAQGNPQGAIMLLTPAEASARDAFASASPPRLARFLATLGQARLALNEFEAARTNLTEAQSILSESPGVTPQERAEVLRSLVALYEAWHTADPTAGHDADAAMWRAQLDATASASE
jgi:hypothetical protein